MGIENKFQQLMGSRTQKQFAEEYGIPLKTVQNWYQGVRTPPPYVLRMIEIIEQNSSQYLESKKGSH